MTTFLRLFGWLMIGGTLFAATHAQAVAEPLSAIAVQKSLVQPVETPPIRVEEQTAVIKSSWLGRPMILAANIFTVAQMGWSSAMLPEFLASKLVHFERSGDRLYLIEDGRAGNISKIFNPEFILAEFPVVTSTSDEIVFDIKNGFNQLYIFEGIFGGGGDALPVSSSKVSDVYANHQTFRFTHLVMPYGSTQSIVMRYQFLYDVSSTIERKLPDETGRVLYFTTRPRYRSGDSTPLEAILRFDISKPTSFYISDNMPMHYREPIRKAITSWNDVFGKDVFQVLDAPKGEVAGRSMLNMIQYVPDHDTGLARADMLAHPITGQVLQANIYVLSGFLKIASDEAVGLSEVVTEKKQIHLRHFERYDLCSLTPADLSPLLDREEVRTSGTTGRERILENLVRSVLAHEMGHLIGLRHNFAGSLYSKLEEKEKWNQLKDVVNGTYSPTVEELPSSSIMDYLASIDDVLMDRPGVYDTIAVKWGYDIDETIPEDAPLVCTDEDTMSIADCTRFDSSAQPINYWMEDILYRTSSFNRWVLKTVGQVTDFIKFPMYPTEQLNQSVLQLAKYVSPYNTVWALDGASPDDRRQGVQDFINQMASYTIDADDNPLTTPNFKVYVKYLKREVAQNPENSLSAKQLKWVSDAYDEMTYPFELIGELLAQGRPVDVEALAKELGVKK